MKAVILFMWLFFLTNIVFAEIINVKDFGALANGVADDTRAIQKAVLKLKEGDVLYFPSGTYLISQSIDIKEKNRITIKGDGENLSILKKAPRKPEYIMRIYYSDNVVVQNLQFIGLSEGIVSWGEQGLMLASTNKSVVEKSTFKHFGDAAVRVHTASDDKKPVNSSKNIVRNNKFLDVTQVTTTQANGFDNGGSEDITIHSNEFKDLKGSIKCASRMYVKGCYIRNNKVYGSSNNAVEISSVAFSEISNNHFENIKNFVANVYPNIKVKEGFRWSNVVIKNNTFLNAGGGVRVANVAYSDGKEFDIQNVYIESNSFTNIGSSYKLGAITFMNSSKKPIRDVVIKDNTFKDIKANKNVHLSGEVKLK